MHKKCNNCKITKTVTDFYKHRSRKKITGIANYQNLCKICWNSRYRKPEHKLKANKNSIAKRYGLTYEEYMIFLEERVSCEVCGSKIRLGIDHDHVTGKIRGMLCMSCNTALGHVKDSIITLKGLIAYLEKNYT